MLESHFEFMTGTSTKCHFTIAFHVHCRSIGGKSDIQDNGCNWHQAMSSHFGSMAADLFLYRIHSDEGGGRRFLPLLSPAMTSG